MKIRNVLAINYYGRSGSVFFQSLFDGHPECITIPGTYISGYAVWYSMLKKYNKSYIVKRFCNDYKVLFDPTYITDQPLPVCGDRPGIDLNFHQMGLNKNERISIDKKTFMNELNIILSHENDEINISVLFVAIHLAYSVARDLNEKSIKWIVFALHSNSISRSYFLKDFNTKIISVIREPIQSAYSLKKHYDWRGTTFGLKDIIKTMESYRPIIGFESVNVAVKLEDLHTIPEKTMLMVCKWSGMAWSKNLLESTFNGKIWHNIKGTNQVQGFNKTIISKKHEDILNYEDRKRFYFLFYRLYKHWNYNVTEISFNLLKRFLIEKDINRLEYLSNRIYLFVLICKNNSLLRKLFNKSNLIIPLLK